MAKASKFSREVRERAVRMVFEHRDECPQRATHAAARVVGDLLATDRGQVAPPSG